MSDQDDIRREREIHIEQMRADIDRSLAHTRRLRQEVLVEPWKITITVAGVMAAFGAAMAAIGHYL